MGKCFESFGNGRRFFICFLVTVTFGVALFVGGFVSDLVLNKLIDAQIKSQLVMENENSKYFTDTWQTFANNDSVPIYKNYRLFNITNYEEVLKGVTPVYLQEVGPYLYRENKVRYDYSFVTDTILHRQYMYYTFQPSPEQNPDTDFIYTPNLALITLFKLLKNFPAVADEIIDKIRKLENAPGLFAKLTISQILWGYEDPLLKYFHSLPVIGGLISPIVPGLDTNQTMDDLRAFSHSIINTGKLDLDYVLQYMAWQGQTEIINIYKSPEKVQGTDASQFHRNIKRTDQLVVWLDQALRAPTLDFLGEGTVRDIDIYQFGLSNRTLKNSTEVPENAKYYQDGPSGVGNLTSLQKGAPAFISKPHFLDADPIYKKYLAGMYPIRSIHDTFINIEPITGATMSAYKRIQANIQITPMAAIPEFSLVPNFLCPIGWIEEFSVITPNLASQLKSALDTANLLKIVAKWLLISLGIVLLVASVLLLVVALIKKKQSAENALYSSLKESDEVVIN